MAWTTMRERDEINSAFVHNVSHALRSPLSTILSVAEILQGNIDDAERAELCALIISTVHAQAKFIDDLIDFELVESGGLVLEVAPTPLRGLLDDVVASAAPVAQAKGLLLVVEPVGSDVVVCDRRRAHQILVSLINNAVEFTSEGHVVVRTYKREQAISIDVVDMGLHVPIEHAERFFAPFVPSADRSSRRLGGSGVGRALSRRLARDMKGDLAIVASELEGATTVRFTLPSAHVEQSAVALP
jgi:signal transduction histidine kinase